MNEKAVKVGKKLLRIAAWTAILVFVLLLTVSLVIQIPAVQQYIVQRAVTFLEEKIGTRVSLDRVSLRIPKKVVLEGIFLEDQQQDTLLYAGKLTVDTDLFALLRRRLELKEVALEDLHGRISRSRDGVFNFDYIIQAFAGEEEDTVSSKGFDFSIRQVDLQRMNFGYSDTLDENYMAISIDRFKAEAQNFDLNNSVIHLNEILLSGVKADMTQRKLPEPAITEDRSEQDFPFDLKFRSVVLKDIDISYSQDASRQKIALNLDELLLTAKAIDLKNHTIALDEFSLSNPFVSYHQYKIDSVEVMPDSIQPVSEETDAPVWNLSLNSFRMDGGGLQFYDFNFPKSLSQFDPHHLWITGLAIDAKDILATKDRYAVKLNQLSFSQSAGLKLNTMRGDISVGNDYASVKNFLLETTNSKIQVDMESKFHSLQQLNTDWAAAHVNIRIKQSHAGWPDVFYFQPDLQKKLPLTALENKAVYLETEIQGTVDDLSVRSFDLRALNETTLQMNGSLKGLPDVDQLTVDVALDKFYTTREDMNTILPGGSVPATITLPEWIQLSGKVSGSVSSPSAQVILESDLGSISVDGGFIHDSTVLVKERYAGSIQVDQFHLGKFLQQDETIGMVDMDILFAGSGKMNEKADVTWEIIVNEFGFRSYDYRDIHMDGMVRDNIASATVSMNDSNLTFQMQSKINFENISLIKYNADLQLENADFKALNLSERPLTTKGIFTVAIDNADLQNLNGKAGIYEVAIFNGENVYKIDSLLFTSVSQEGTSLLKIDSEIIRGEFSGSFDLQELPGVMEQYFHTYYALQDTIRSGDMGHQYFDFYLDILNTSLLTDVLVPGLDHLVPGEIRGRFDSEEKALDILVHIKELEYNSIAAEDIKFIASSDRNVLSYEFTSQNFSTGLLHVPAINFGGQVASDSVTASLTIYDSLLQQRYLLGGIFYSVENAYRFHLLPEQVMLNYDPWSVPVGNYLMFGKAGFETEQMELSNQQQQIRFYADTHRDSALSVSLSQVNLQTLVSMAFATDTLATGIMQGDIVIQGTQNKELSVKLQIRELAFSKHLLGDVHIAVDQSTSDRFDVDLNINGPATKASIAGYYDASMPDSALSLNAEVSSFDLASIEPLLFKNVKEISGNLSASLRVRGKLGDPVINGNLNFENVALVPVYINSRLKLENETLSFSERNVVLQNFTFLDDQNNPLRLSGRMGRAANEPLKFDLTASARNFLVLNTKKADNELFYGNVRINTTTKISGTSIHPEVNMEVSLSDESEFTYIVPQEEISVLEQKGTVEFVIRNPGDDAFTASIKRNLEKPQDTVAVFKGITLTARIAVTDKSTFTIVIDPITDDKLIVKGNTTLTLDIDPTGNMNLAGRYELTSGTYSLTFYRLMKRDFQIQKGSTITWSGDAMNAALDITASYQVETSPLELMSNQVTSSSQEYGQRLPFIVLLKVKGELLRPDVSFALDMPEQRRNAMGGNVYALLQDINTRESDLNKQVFALLILKRFIADNPLQSQTGGGLEGAARTSVSRLLTEQLNRMSENIKGVQLSFDVRSFEEYSNGQADDRTQLQLGVSKGLLNDRLVVKLSGNVNIEGEQSRQETLSDYIGDLALEYKITEDGRFRITGFYNSNYDMIDGELKETGVGLIYIKDYDSLRELFRSNEKGGK